MFTNDAHTYMIPLVLGSTSELKSPTNKAGRHTFPALNKTNNRPSLLKCVPEQRHREKSLLVIISDYVIAAVVGLAENILVIGHVFKFQGELHGTPAKFTLVGYFQIGAEIVRQFLRIRMCVVID